MSNQKSLQLAQGCAAKVSPRLMFNLFVAVASLATMPVVQAQSAESYGNNHAPMYGTANSYMGLNAGQSDFSRVNNGTGLFGSDKNTTAYNIYAGSYFNNKTMGFELGYIDFGSINRAGGRTKADGINLSLIGRMPISGAFNLLGKVGTLYGRTDVSSAAGSGITASSETGFDWTYGVGAEYAFNPQWSGVLQYDEHFLKFSNSGRDRITNLALGARYHF